MRILLINTSERIGGAAVACGRLMSALKRNGIKVKTLVRDRQTNQLSVVSLKDSWLNVVKFAWERFVIWNANGFRNRKNLFSVDIANTGTDITKLPAFKEADIIHLHWVNQGMLSLKDIQKILDSGKPVVWTMHDMWPGTGICHYARLCDHYQSECHDCQYLNGGGSAHDLSYKVFRKKKKLFSGHNITFVGCSRWIAEQTSKSALLQGHTFKSIPNPIDTTLFRPLDRQEARKALNLPLDEKLILFGSVKITDERKGLTYLIESCKALAEKHPETKEKWSVVVFGANSGQLAHLIPFKVYPLDYVSDPQRIVDIYNAVDTYVTPSLEDNLPNTIMEAMSCGIPCVGFNVGGIPEMIDHEKNGYVAKYRNSEDFAKGIYWTLEGGRHEELSENARQKVLDNYSEDKVAQQYIEIYNSRIC